MPESQNGMKAWVWLICRPLAVFATVFTRGTGNGESATAEDRERISVGGGLG
jgi:hypothetical protein